jgi:hypothetical protein
MSLGENLWICVKFLKHIKNRISHLCKYNQCNLNTCLFQTTILVPTMSNIHKFHCAIETLNWLIYTITFDLTQINIVDDTAYDKIIITFTTLFGHSSRIKLIFIKFCRTIWEIGGQIVLRPVPSWITAVKCWIQLRRQRLKYMWRKTEYPEKTTDLPQVNDTLDHIMLYWVPIFIVNVCNISMDNIR